MNTHTHTCTEKSPHSACGNWWSGKKLSIWKSRHFVLCMQPRVYLAGDPKQLEMQETQKGVSREDAGERWECTALGNSAKSPGVYLQAPVPTAQHCTDLTLVSSPILNFPGPKFLWLLCAIFQPTDTFIFLGAAAFPGGTGQIILVLKDVHVFISGHRLSLGPLFQNGLGSESA